MVEKWVIRCLDKWVENLQLGTFTEDKERAHTWDTPEDAVVAFVSSQLHGVTEAEIVPIMKPAN